MCSISSLESLRLGIKNSLINIDGNLFICDPHGHKIHIYENSGDFIGHINIPERVANCTFGGENNSLLYITASTSLYLLKTGTIGQ